MEKKEILEKSRKEKRDEGMRNAEYRGYFIGITCFGIVFLIIYLLLFIKGHGNSLASNAVTAMFWAYFAGSAYPKYKFTGGKSYLIVVVCGGTASLCYFAQFIITIFSM